MFIDTRPTESTYIRRLPALRQEGHVGGEADPFQRTLPS
jgi:hypothetical protein